MKVLLGQKISHHMTSQKYKVKIKAMHIIQGYVVMIMHSCVDVYQVRYYNMQCVSEHLSATAAAAAAVL